jgi:hypothetical protein
MSDKNTDIIKQIENIEEQLKKLRIELGKGKPFKRTGPYETGEEVVILNPKTGQGKSGKLLKVNQITRYVTIDTINSKGHKEKVVRSFGKIKRKDTEE